MRAVPISLVLAFAATALPVAVHAQITEPNGLVVPRDSRNGEVQLYELFRRRGEAVDWRMNASVTPQTFSPRCEFTASFVLNEAYLRYGVGWYNVDPSSDTPPSRDAIVEVVPAGAPVGTMVSAESVREDPRYAGGEIGFALLRDPPHFTEARYNTRCESGPCASTPGPWQMSLVYPSTETPNAFYVAFEDGDIAADGWENDGDFNDDVFFFTGLTCPGAGEACTVEEAEGVCATGLTECAPGGELGCRPVMEPSAETCDATDEDCDGLVDEGDDLCSLGEICLRGRCVERCTEFGCGDAEVCATEGYCVDAACEDVDCPDGEVCRDGECIAPCDGVTCPGTQVCRHGACVDPCADVDCPEGRVCEDGVCQEPCGCRGCADGLECGEDGACVPAGCAGMSCELGLVCEAGRCVDACEGAVCPDGEMCAGGECVPVPPPADGGPSTRDGGLKRILDSGMPPTRARDAGTDGGSDAGAANQPQDLSEEPGCACRAAGTGRTGPGWLTLPLLLALGLFRRMRRRA